jgi:AbrB family looped-hinge helix DNA binding protein
MAPPNFHEVSRAKVDSAGRVVIPTAARQRLGIRRGDEVVIDADEHGVHIKTTAQVIQELQEHFTRFTTPADSVVDELFRERRDEAGRD